MSPKGKDEPRMLRRVRFELPTEHAESDSDQEDLGLEESNQVQRNNDEPRMRLTDEEETKETEESFEEENSPTEGEEETPFSSGGERSSALKKACQIP
ncbi:hypothetical protein GN244_ATG17903 [Phytophthora infestans]|nr:hypothetical protein GN244_ATG17903 [Phytophthora infestans]